MRYAISTETPSASIYSTIVNPFEPYEHSYLYQLDQSISVLRDIGWYFQLYSNFKYINE